MLRVRALCLLMKHIKFHLCFIPFFSHLFLGTVYTHFYQSSDRKISPFSACFFYVWMDCVYSLEEQEESVIKMCEKLEDVWRQGTHFFGGFEEVRWIFSFFKLLLEHVHHIRTTKLPQGVSPVLVMLKLLDCYTFS